MKRKASYPVGVLLSCGLLVFLFITWCTHRDQAFAGPVTGPVLPRIKAVQVLILPGTGIEEFRPRLRKYKSAGFDTVILRAFQMPGDRPHGPAAGRTKDGATGVYFPTEAAPLVMDLVTPFVRMCREVGIRPFAWMVTRNARFGNTDLPRETVFHPDTGTLGPTAHLDVLDPAAETYLKDLFVDLARTGVDGILLQDDLASRMIEGFTEGNMERYRRDTGDVVPPFLYLGKVTTDDGRSWLKPAAGFNLWVRWKADRLVWLARLLQESVSEASPGTPLVMNQMYETVTDPANGRLWLSQDLETSLAEGPSYAAVMLYHSQMQDELGLGLADTLDLVDRSLAGLGPSVANRGRVVLKFQTRDWKTGASVASDDLVSALMTAWKGGWSVALVPPPTEKQLQSIEPILKGM